jgi:hypothetical protein
MHEWVSFITKEVALAKDKIIIHMRMKFYNKVNHKTITMLEIEPNMPTATLICWGRKSMK